MSARRIVATLLAGLAALGVVALGPLPANGAPVYREGATEYLADFEWSVLIDSYTSAGGCVTNGGFAPPCATGKMSYGYTNHTATPAAASGWPVWFEVYRPFWWQWDGSAWAWGTTTDYGASYRDTEGNTSTAPRRGFTLSGFGGAAGAGTLVTQTGVTAAPIAEPGVTGQYPYYGRVCMRKGTSGAEIECLPWTRPFKQRVVTAAGYNPPGVVLGDLDVAATPAGSGATGPAAGGGMDTSSPGFGDDETRLEECLPSGWGLLNPLTYVKAIGCALRWAFVPEPGAFSAMWDDVTTAAEGSYPGGPLLWLGDALTDFVTGFGDGDAPTWAPTEGTAEGGCRSIVITVPMPAGMDAVVLPLLSNETCTTGEAAQDPSGLLSGVRAVSYWGSAFIVLWSAFKTIKGQWLEDKPAGSK